MVMGLYEIELNNRVVHCHNLLSKYFERSRQIPRRNQTDSSSKAALPQPMCEGGNGNEERENEVQVVPEEKHDILEQVICGGLYLSQYDNQQISSDSTFIKSNRRPILSVASLPMNHVPGLSVVERASFMRIPVTWTPIGVIHSTHRRYCDEYRKLDNTSPTQDDASFGRPATIQCSHVVDNPTLPSIYEHLATR